MRTSIRAILITSAIVVAAIAGRTFASADDPRLRAEFDQALTEFDQAQASLADDPAGSRQLFRAAAQRFASIIAAGVRNGRLEFNLANCYLQAGDIGRAILHYRRAERLIPADPMLKDNLETARSRCLTSIRPTRRSAFLKNLVFLHYQTSDAARFSAALGLYVLVWAFLIVRTLAPRRAFTIAAVVCAAGAAAAGTSVAANRWADRNAPDGVIIHMDVVVSKGPGRGYQRKFEQPLQPGVEFTLGERARSGWWRIELADGKSGWIESDHAELIPRSPSTIMHGSGG